MLKRSLPTLPTRLYWFTPLVGILTTIASVCSVASTPLVAQSPATRQPTPPQVPGIPNRPDMVTVVPFYTKAGETDQEKTKVIIPAEVSGHQGLFILDLGEADLDLNRTFLRPRAAGGLDTVLATDTADTHRLPEWDGDDQVHVTFRIGTMKVDPANFPKSNLNASLNHSFGNFSWVFAPHLGNIGPSALEPFETIIDYTHRRVVLILLDSAGHRLVDVPAYTPKWSAPLIDMDRHARWWGVRMLLGGVPDSLIFDTGAPINSLSPATKARVGTHLANGALDSLVLAGRTFTAVPFEDDSYDILGYSFLGQLGVVGFNHRTHQFILYR
jgi:hypothetical protein